MSINRVAKPNRFPRAPAGLARLWILGLVVALAVMIPLWPKTEGPSPRAHAAETSAPALEDTWEAFYLQNTKIGYGHTTECRVERDGQKLIETETLNHLSIARFGQKTEQEFKTWCWETPEGKLVSFKADITFGPTPTRVEGHVDGAQMVIQTVTQGRTTTDRLPWSDDIRGFRASERSLEEQPLKPGEKRKFKMLMPVVNQVAQIELKARDFETTSVLGTQTRLLKVDCKASLPDGNLIASTEWVDAQGHTIKSRVAALKQESYRTTRELALAEQPAGASFDLGNDLIVKLPQPLPNPHRTKEVRYRVELTDDDPAKVFATGPTQAVKSLGPHTAEVTVRSLRPQDLPAVDKAAPTVAKQYTSANNMLQIDDPRVQAMVREAKGTATSPREVAAALEKFVNRAVTKKNFSQAFATAAEVAESREGDCTEHAVLLAALARACQIPSRVAIGLVYVESAGGFGYHMWTELYLDGTWVPMDAVLGQGGTSAAYLKLTDSSLDGPAAYSSFLPVAQVVGQLKLSVID